jgi:microcin C transport system permease protein
MGSGNPIWRRQWRAFRRNRRGFWSLGLFLVLFVVSLGAEFVANDRPIMVQYQGDLYFPVFKTYPETTFGGLFETEANYRDPYVAELIEDDG